MKKPVSLLLVFAFLLQFFTLHAQQRPFITTWKTDIVHAGSSCASCVTIPTHPDETYNYEVDWDNDGLYDQTGITGSVTHNFGTAGTYTIRIRGDFPRIYCEPYLDQFKLLAVEQWGDIQWSSMEGAFYGAGNMILRADDLPDLSRVKSMRQMFAAAWVFTGDLSGWDVSRVTDMSGMFISANAFISDLSNWDVSQVTDMSRMFDSADSFHSDLSNWDVSGVTDMSRMFDGAASFNSDLSNWDVSQVTNMNHMFDGAASFNSDLSNWNVSQVTDMSAMFEDAQSFTSDLSNWDVSQVTNMHHMFSGANSFTSDLSSWNVSQVTDMGDMFVDAWLFNSDLSNWDVSKVTDMGGMFEGARSFTSDLSNWDVSKVTDMGGMFEDARSFTSNLGSWNISSVLYMYYMLDNSGMTTEDYDQTLIGWESRGVSGLTLEAMGLTYCLGEAARASLIDNYGWTISGDELDPECNHPPTAVCKALALTADATCQATAQAALFDGGSTDPDQDLLIFTVEPAGPFALGTTNLTLTVSDGEWSSSCQTTVTVTDHTAPKVICSGGTVSFNGETDLALSSVVTSQAMDACGVSGGRTLFPANVTCQQVGQNVPVVVSYSDVNGNVGRCTTTVQVIGLPCGFENTDIGCSSQAGYNAATGVFTLQTSGCGNTNPNSDQLGFISQELCGNGSISFHVASVSPSTAFAGITLRTGAAPGAVKAEVVTNLAYTARGAVREYTGAAAWPSPFFFYGRHWLKLERLGNQIRVYTSTNGQSWSILLVRNLNLPPCVYVGMIAYGPGVGTATFDNVVVTGGGTLRVAPNQQETSGFELPNSDFRQAPLPSLRGEETRLTLAVYPNPTSGQLTVELPADLPLEGATLEVIDGYGRSLLRETPVDYRQQLDLSSRPVGTYLLRLQTADGQRWLERVVVQPRP